ncbi:TBC1 domain family member 5 isoform X2 [Pararge aegeria]|uniref:TBC1 domain family member 5 isoform X2 n=1 Tax=Pararge aegeria TaxID=116150 RepID=UPI0019D2A8A7|nr:TBC1 domain family member 5 isoform X2 [Pararge aegeria]
MEYTNLNGSPSSPSKPFCEASDYDLQFPTWSLEFLKTAAVEQRLVRPRSLAWAILLNAIPSPCGDILMSIRGHRNFYDDLKNKLSMDPRAVIGDDPLSQNDESAWKQHFCDNELKALILQDVVRTFPDEAYFRDKDVQDMMVRVLFFWARSHPSPGYRQGMHEILAPALCELHSDRQLAPPHLSDTLRYYLQEDYLEHDSYMLFSAIMKGLEKFYSTGDVIPNNCGRLPTARTLHSQNEVVRYLERLRENYLVPADSELATHLADCNVSLELFGIRWLRLLFGREFPRSEIPHLWGFIFSDGPMLPNLHYVVLAMLLPIRNILLESDAGTALSILMRPSSVSVGHVCALALYLRCPHEYPKPPPPHIVNNVRDSVIDASSSVWSYEQQAEEEATSSGSEGVAEGGDVARSLAALALLRARLPPAVAALQAALPRPPPQALAPLHQILQLAALLQCRNHALIDVETALEAAENQSSYTVGRRQLVPVVVLPAKLKQTPPLKPAKQVRKVKEVPLKVFHQVECDSSSDLPFLDPLRLRTE